MGIYLRTVPYYVDGVENHYYVPPIDFDPLTASDEELCRYCFPQRPDPAEKEAYLQWTELMSNYSGVPEPEISVTIKPVEETKDSFFAKAVSSRTSLIWSGYESNLYPGSSALYTQVQMDYEQPAISKADGRCLNSYWVGLGGRNTERLVQAGTATEGTSDHYAWYEYLNDIGDFIYMETISSLTINAGDDIHVYISFQRANNVFTYYIANNSTGKSASGSVNLTASTQYDGTTAEWIVERCSVGGVPTNLGDYGTVTLTNCQATLNTSNLKSRPNYTHI